MPSFAVLPPDAKPPPDLNMAVMDRYRSKTRRFPLGEQAVLKASGIHRIR
jgi:hypothetical protein